MDQDLLQRIALYAFPFLFSLCFHEYAHAWVANKLGDPTAKYSGRLSLNPIVHIDLVWTIILPLITLIIGGIFFGGAKPVPIDSRNFKDQDKGMALVAFAGPLSNIFLAFIFTIILAITYKLSNPIQSKIIISFLKMLQAGIIINFFLAFFNLIPIPPLDGSRILKLFLSYEAGITYYKLQPYSFILILVFWQFGLFKYLVGVPASILYNLCIGLAL